MCCAVYVVRSKMYDNKSTKAGKGPRKARFKVPNHEVIQ